MPESFSVHTFKNCLALRLDNNGRVIDVSEPFLRLHGFSRAQFLGKRFEDLIEPLFDTAHHRRNFERARKGGLIDETVFRLRVSPKSGWFLSDREGLIFRMDYFKDNGADCRLCYPLSGYADHHLSRQEETAKILVDREFRILHADENFHALVELMGKGVVVRNRSLLDYLAPECWEQYRSIKRSWREYLDKMNEKAADRPWRPLFRALTGRAWKKECRFNPRARPFFRADGVVLRPPGEETAYAVFPYDLPGIEKDVRIEFVAHDIKKKAGDPDAWYVLSHTSAAYARTLPDHFGYAAGVKSGRAWLKRNNLFIACRPLSPAPAAQDVRVRFERMGPLLALSLNNREALRHYEDEPLNEPELRHAGVMATRETAFTGFTVFSRDSLFDPEKKEPGDFDVRLTNLPRRVFSMSPRLLPLDSEEFAQVITLRDVTSGRASRLSTRA